MTIPQLARKVIDIQQGVLMSANEVRKIKRWVEVQSTWERMQFILEIDRLEAEGLRGDRRL